MNRKLKILIISAGVIITPVLLSPLPGFNKPFSTVVEASDGSLLGARIADDGQWRFPGSGQVPDKFEKALLSFEDRYFRFHPGINPVSLFRALILNIKAGEIVSGGSTITMQVARISHGNSRRTYPAKVSEMLSALKLELFRSKKTILRMYTANAPFGGNIVGLEAASWRYLGKPPSAITWSEAAALAILPNSPALVFPGKNQEILKIRRDALLRKLYEREYLDSLTLVLALDEPLPGEPGPLPDRARHLTDYFYLRERGKRIRTTIDYNLQERAVEIINAHQKILSGNFINNSAAIILRAGTGEVLAYVGNSDPGNVEDHGQDVDIIQATRSTGSILKPFLYAAMQQSGELLPDALVADIPARFPGFSPKNFDLVFSGAVAASSALSQSLNIPAVKMLQVYTPERFLDLLKKIGFTTFTKPAGHYGLSLILGGGETSLWELAGVYASLSRVLDSYNREGKYFIEDYHGPVLVKSDAVRREKSVDPEPPLSASSVWLTYEALKKVNRPEGESGWQFFYSSQNIAWKTGTSFGFRDAWAAGTTKDYVIGVWAGNADGEGRPGLTGITAAAPILFDLVNIMDNSGWFKPPLDEMTMVKVCKKSGFRAGPACEETEEKYVCLNGLRSEVCPFHKIIHLDRSGKNQVNADCVTSADISNVSWFVLPPAMEYFYRQKHPEYRSLPPLRPGCRSENNIPEMEFIYPTPGIKIFIPRDETGLQTRIIPEIVHRNSSVKIFWHLDEKYIGTTRFPHQTEILAGAGDHVLTAVDQDGNSIRCPFTVMSKID